MSQTAPSFRSWKRGIGPEYFTGSAPLKLLKDSVCLIKWPVNKIWGNGTFLRLYLKLQSVESVLTFQNEAENILFVTFPKVWFGCLTKRKKKKKETNLFWGWNVSFPCLRSLRFCILTQTLYPSHCFLSVIPLIPPLKRINLKQEKLFILFFYFPFFSPHAVHPMWSSLPSSICSSKIWVLLKPTLNILSLTELFFIHKLIPELPVFLISHKLCEEKNLRLFGYYMYVHIQRTSVFFQAILYVSGWHYALYEEVSWHLLFLKWVLITWFSERFVFKTPYLLPMWQRIRKDWKHTLICCLISFHSVHIKVDVPWHPGIFRDPAKLLFTLSFVPHWLVGSKHKFVSSFNKDFIFTLKFIKGC